MARRNGTAFLSMGTITNGTILLQGKSEHFEFTFKLTAPYCEFAQGEEVH